MINFVKSAIDKVIDNKRTYVLDDVHFTRDRKWPFSVFINFMIFRIKTTIRHSINHMYKLLNEFDFKKISPSDFSQQRIFIDPEAFKVINREFLKNIGITDKKRSMKTFKGKRVFAGDGSDLEIFNLLSTRFDFKVKSKTKKYTYPAIAKFSAVMDVLNGYLIDGTLGNFKEGDLPMIHKNLENLHDVIDFPNSIFTFDRGYVGLELDARLLELGTNFVIRLRKGVYKEEINNMKSDDEIIKLKLTDERLAKFHDPELKAKYEKIGYIKLRIVKTKVKVIRFDKKNR